MGSTHIHNAADCYLQFCSNHTEPAVFDENCKYANLIQTYKK